MLKYLFTKSQLEQVGQRLGAMDQGNYGEFMDKAKQAGLPNPRLVIETELKQPSVYGITEVVYPIAECEWAEFTCDPLAKYVPIVYVVNGNEYTAGI